MTEEPKRISEGRRIDRPEPGFFVMRFVKRGPEIPARIWRPCACTVNGGDGQSLHDWLYSCDRYPHLQGEIAGKPAALHRVWEGGKPTTEAHWRYLTDVRKWAETHAPEDPAANPGQPIELGAMPPLF